MAEEKKEFALEPRYVVLKLSDMAAAGLTDEETKAFNTVCDKVSAFRTARGKLPLFCAVTEADWKCFDTVVSLIKREHEQNEARKVCEVEGHLWREFRETGLGEKTRICTRCRHWDLGDGNLQDLAVANAS